MEVVPTLRQYNRAEERIRTSIELRCQGLDWHTYPGREDDLSTIKSFHNSYGIPPAGVLKRLVWRLRGGGGLT